MAFCSSTPAALVLARRPAPGLLRASPGPPRPGSVAPCRSGRRTAASAHPARGAAPAAHGRSACCAGCGSAGWVGGCPTSPRRGPSLARRWAWSSRPPWRAIMSCSTLICCRPRWRRCGVAGGVGTLAASGVAQFVQHPVQFGHALLASSMLPCCAASRAWSASRCICWLSSAHRVRIERHFVGAALQLIQQRLHVVLDRVLQLGQALLQFVAVDLRSGPSSPGPARRWRPAALPPARARSGRSALPPCAARAATCRCCAWSIAVVRLVELQQVVECARDWRRRRNRCRTPAGSAAAYPARPRRCRDPRDAGSARAARRSARGRPGW